MLHAHMASAFDAAGPFKLFCHVSQIDEHLIEVFVRYPEQLDEDTRQAISVHIATSRPACAIAQFYREFYQELDAIDHTGTPALEAFFENLMRPQPDNAGHPRGADTPSPAPEAE